MKPTARVGFYSQSDIVGGAERALLNLLMAGSGSFERVMIGTSDAVLAAAAEAVPGLARHRVESGAGVLDEVRRHRRLFADLELDLLQITLPNPFASRPAQLAAYSLGLPTVAVQQLVLAPRRRRGAWMVRVLARPLAATVAVGHRSAADLERLYGLAPERIHVIHNGSPLPAPPPPPGGLDRRPVVGCVARYEDQKGLDRLIRAMAEIPKARLILAGGGSRRDHLIELARHLGIDDRVEIGPWNNDARSLIAALDVFALPSVNEAFPLTIVEAMLAGTPVVATDVGSVREAVIDGRTGRLVAPGDHQALVGALRRLLEDRVEAERMAGAALALARKEFTADRMAERYEDLWRSVLARGSGVASTIRQPPTPQ